MFKKSLILAALMAAISTNTAFGADLADDLRRHLAGQPVLAQPPHAAYLLRKALQKRLPVVLVINKVDRPDSRIGEVVDERRSVGLVLDEVVIGLRPVAGDLAYCLLWISAYFLSAKRLR